MLHEFLGIFRAHSLSLCLRVGNLSISSNLVIIARWLPFDAWKTYQSIRIAFKRLWLEPTWVLMFEGLAAIKTLGKAFSLWLASFFRLPPTFHGALTKGLLLDFLTVRLLCRYSWVIRGYPNRGCSADWLTNWANFWVDDPRPELLNTMIAHTLNWGGSFGPKLPLSRLVKL